MMRRSRVRAFFIRLGEQFPGLDLQLISPLAEGADQLVAEVATDLDIPLIVPLPMEISEYEKDFASEEGLAAHAVVLLVRGRKSDTRP